MACDKSDITIGQLETYHNTAGYYLVGRVTNRCNGLVAPVVKMTVYNPHGSLRESDQFWPNSTYNMDPNSSTTFEVSVDSDDLAPIGKVEFHVLSVKPWRIRE